MQTKMSQNFDIVPLCMSFIPSILGYHHNACTSIRNFKVPPTRPSHPRPTPPPIKGRQMDVGSKFDRAEMPLDDDEFDLGKKWGRGDGGVDQDDNQDITTGTEEAVTQSSKVYSVFPFWIEASTPIINLYGDGEANGIKEYEDGFHYDGANDGFQYDNAHDLKRVTYYDYDRRESLKPTQVPMHAAGAEGNSNPKGTTLVQPYHSVSHSPSASSKAQTATETSTEKSTKTVKDISSSLPTSTSPSATATGPMTTTIRKIGTASTKSTSPDPSWSSKAFSESKSTSTSTASTSRRWRNQTPKISKITRNGVSSTATSPLNPTTAAQTLQKTSVVIKSELQRESTAKVIEIEDHIASTAPTYEVYDYGEKEYGVSEGSLESDLLKLLDKLARRYNESAAEGG